MTDTPPHSAPTLHALTVDLPGRAYRIVIGAGAWSDPSSWEGLPRAQQAVVVTNATVAPLYGERLLALVGRHHARCTLVALPDGEAFKDWQHLHRIFDHLLQQACDRKTVLYALGGGVVGDMTGFAAACYMRGVPFVQVPTTLLAQVDSSVGGKTAINHPLGKNMIGAFHQPVRVVCDLDALDTLPARELAAGLAEVIKLGAIADADFLGWLERHLEALLARDKTSLAEAVRRACEIKARIVTLDERESGLRALLNFGHTFGHAIEAGLGYGEWLHGEAIGCGMVLASRLSVTLGLVPADFAERMRSLVARAGLPVEAPPLGAARYLELMRIDKKAEGGDIRYVVVESPGRGAVQAVPDALVARVLDAGWSAGSSAGAAPSR